jgi:small-conductance mechanosensitive channel
MDAQEKINLAIHRRFEQEGIEFAFPTSTVYLRGAGPGQAQDPPSGAL